MTRSAAARLAGAIVAVGFFMAQPALAQNTVGPPDEEGKPIVQWVCVILFTGVTVAISSKNPKRTHQT